MFMCGDLLVIPDVSGDVHQLKRKLAPRPLEALAIYDKIKQIKEKKRHSVFVKGSLHFNTTFIPHTSTTHTSFCEVTQTYAGSPIHKCSDRTTNPDRVDCICTVLFLSNISFLFFWKMTRVSCSLA